MVQIHDFNPGIEPNGLFWTSPINPNAVSVHPGSGAASMGVTNLPSRDFTELVNALLLGPSLPAVVSFHIAWSASHDRQRFHDAPSQFDADLSINSARASWRGETAAALFVADAPSTSVSLFAEVGHERNGVFFPAG